MQMINFTKMVASGNDFVILNRKPRGPLASFARLICDRRFGVGADGLLLLEKVRQEQIAMRIFNADGSEAEMCGNGARCAALWAKKTGISVKSPVRIKTKAGIIDSLVMRDTVRIKLTDPRNLMLNLSLKINGRALGLSFINTGVPHAVLFADKVDGIDVVGLGRQVRNHRFFQPRGTNVDFVQVEGPDSVRLRTYERGVEDETLACGTGSVAAALVFALKGGGRDGVVNVQTQSREALKVYFERATRTFKNVWLEGKARIVYQGAYYV